ncbi:MAG: TRAM domain-containing protein, partial [Planctomycetia bacterium]|nr:TRAM domain-containing protein [Planctomycetia bacterium]
RTPCDRIVVFDGPLSLTGQLVQVRVTQSHPFTLMGELSSTKNL